LDNNNLGGFFHRIGGNGMKFTKPQTLNSIARACACALFFFVAASSAMAQSLATSDAGSTSFGNTPIGPSSQFWDPVAGAAALQNSFDYATNITNVAINTVNTVNNNAGTTGANVTNLITAANNSYNNSVAVYNYANAEASVSNSALSAADGAYNSSVDSANTANNSYNVITAAAAAPATGAAPHVITGFIQGACNGETGIGTVTTVYADGVNSVFSTRCF